MARMRADTIAAVGETLDVAIDMSKASYFASKTGKRLG